MRILILIILTLIASLLFSSFSVLKVSGNSMLPLLKNGDYILVRRNFMTNRKTLVGDVVVFSNPVNKKLTIKECSAVMDDSVFVTGINLPLSTDSRHYGRIFKNNIKGWLWKKF